MINIKGRIINNNSVETVEEALKIDYVVWYKYKEELKFYYSGICLKRLNDDCSFNEEIECLKHQIMLIDNFRD